MYHLQSLLVCMVLLASDLRTLVVADINPFVKSEDYINGVWGNHTRQRYLSNPLAIGPVANVMTRTVEGRSPSKYILYSPFGPSQPPSSPSLIDADNLAMVWFGPTYGLHTIGPTVQSCKGVDYITFWSGKQLYDRPAGSNYVFDSEYNLKWNVSTQGHLEYADSHEFFLTPQCTGIVSAFQTGPYDFGPFGPTESWLKDSYFQEIDLETGELLFEWRASTHVNVTDTYWTAVPGEAPPSPLSGFDFFHMNSVAKDAYGNYLISARHTHALYYISGRDGSILWRLGGKHSDFTDLSNGKATNFQWQHFARWVDRDSTLISMYDNANAENHISPDGTLSRGIVLRLDLEAMTVRLEHEFNATNGINSIREGSMQVLNDSPQPGNVMLGYGGDPGWTEYSSDGKVLDDVMFGPPHLNRETADNYRALKVNWTGMPRWPPRIVPGPDLTYRFDGEQSMFEVMLNDEQGNLRPNSTAYFSWNGATEIASWVLLASNETDQLTISDHFWAQLPKGGFEDNCFMGQGTKYVLALAVDEFDTVLGSTDTMNMASYVEGPAGPNTHTARNTEALTAAWRQYVADHPSGSLMAKLRAQWRTKVKAIADQSHLPILIVLLLIGVCGPLLVVVLRRRMWGHAGPAYMKVKLAGISRQRSSRDEWMKDYSDGEDEMEDKHSLPSSSRSGSASY